MYRLVVTNVERHLVAAGLIAAGASSAYVLYGYRERRWFPPPANSFGGLGWWLRVHPWWSEPAAAAALIIALALAWFIVVPRRRVSTSTR